MKRSHRIILTAIAIVITGLVVYWLVTDPQGDLSNIANYMQMIIHKSQ